jgi:hypothetical protein
MPERKLPSKRDKVMVKSCRFNAGREMDSTLYQVGCDLQDCGEGILADGFEEFNADEMHIAGVLLSFNPCLNRRHAGGDQRGRRY